MRRREEKTGGCDARTWSKLGDGAGFFQVDSPDDV